jgi:MSHA biogenesis protein MshE
MTDAMRRSDLGGFTAAANASDAFRPFAQVALEYARQGVTTVEEVVRISGEVAELRAATAAPPGSAAGAA